MRDRLVCISEWMSCCEHIGFSFSRSSGRSPNSHVACVVQGDWAVSDSQRCTTRAFEQCGQHPNSAAQLSTSSLSQAERQSCMQQDVRQQEGCSHLLADAGMELKLEVLTDSTANLGMHYRTRHLDVKWLCTQEAVQAGRFSLKEVGTYSNVSDPTTKRHDEERVKVLMTWERLRYTDDTDTQSRGPMTENAMQRSQPIEFDENVLKLWSGISSLAGPGGSECRELGDGRLAKRSQDQHTSNALVERGSANTSI